ncbi:MAG: enoyl-CoA hydratase/isomerase family protein [Caulobacterales bacterium]
MSDSPEILYEIDADGIALITLNRPHEGNALTSTMGKRIGEIWEDVRTNDAVRVVIITGAGERHFCTGASVSGLKTSEDGDTGLKRGTFQEIVRWSPYQNKIWKPVICCVNGLVAGGGLHFVVDSDVVVSSSSAQFMDTHTSVGQVGAIENIGLARRATLGAALLLTLAGRGYRMDAARAHQIGIIDLLEPDAATARLRAFELAKAMAANSPNAMRLSKQAIWGAVENGYERALEAGWNLLMLQWSHPDFAEGPRAFMDKRAPNWNPDPNAEK